MMMPRTVFVLLAAGLVLAISGCVDGGTSDSGANGTPTATSSASQSPAAATESAEPSLPSSSPAGAEPTAPPATETSAPTQPAAGPPALSTLIVSPAGIGSLVMGQPIAAESPATAMATWDPAYCATDARPAGDPGAGAWRSAYSTTTVPWAPQPIDAFTVYVVDQVQEAALNGITVWSPELATASGIHPGSTREELEAAYPAFASVTPKGLTDVYVVKDPDAIPGELWFEVANSGYAEAVAATTPIEGLVLWIAVHPTSDSAPYSLTETDSLGGPCAP
jgi:hypothetical protein